VTIDNVTLSVRNAGSGADVALQEND
jgi:hypothetical protein